MNSVLTTTLTQIGRFGSLVKFSHSIFGLPFAFAMVVLASRKTAVSPAQIGWILIALISARTAAMAFNRLIDRHIDAQNVRTKTREIPSGVITARAAGLLVSLASCLFVLSAAALGNHCLVLSPVVLGVLLGYSLAKRFTASAHLILGLALAAAPGGAWYALTADVSWPPVVLMAGVLLWVAGFDILYSCQDADFDQRAGLHSIPVRFGVQGAFTLARFGHGLAVLLFLGFGVLANLGPGYYLGLTLFTLVLASQHFIISPHDLRRIDAAFFTRNGLASLLFFVAVVVG